MLQQCNHPNVVRYLGSYQGEEYLWVRIMKAFPEHELIVCMALLF
jgi:hypothetical protein